MKLKKEYFRKIGRSLKTPKTTLTERKAALIVTLKMKSSLKMRLQTTSKILLRSLEVTPQA